MAKLDWDADSRRAKLINWISKNDLSPKWWETDTIANQDVDHWVKAQSRAISKRIRKSTVLQESDPLYLLNNAIQIEDYELAKKLGQELMTRSTFRSNYSKDEREQMVLLISMILAI